MSACRQRTGQRRDIDSDTKDTSTANPPGESVVYERMEGKEKTYSQVFSLHPQRHHVPPLPILEPLRESLLCLVEA